MNVGPRKRLQLSERQARVLQLYHQGLSSRAIAERLRAEEKADPKGKKGWGITQKTVLADINAAIAYYRQEAVDFYEDRLIRELMVADASFHDACVAYEESRKITKESASLKGEGSASNEVTTSAPDPRFSAEKRKWQDQRLKLLGVVREMCKPALVPPDDKQSDPAADLAPYFASIEQFMRSITSQSPTVDAPAALKEEVFC